MENGGLADGIYNKKGLECTFQYDMVSGMSKKEDILNTTLKLVIEKGIHNTPMSLFGEYPTKSTVREVCFLFVYNF